MVLLIDLSEYVLSSQSQLLQSINQPPTLLAGWEGSLGTGSNSLETTYILFELPYVLP